MIIFVKKYKHNGKRKKMTFLQILGSILVTVILLFITQPLAHCFVYTPYKKAVLFNLLCVLISYSTYKKEV